MTPTADEILLRTKIEKYAFRFVRRVFNRLISVEYYKNAGKYLPDISVDAPPFVAPVYDDDDFEIVYNPRIVPTGPRLCICTNVCAKKKSVCTRPVCTFAHTLEEWAPAKCKFGRRCSKKKKCQRLHDKETPSDVLKRVGISFMSVKQYNKTRNFVLQSKTRAQTDLKFK